LGSNPKNYQPLKKIKSQNYLIENMSDGDTCQRLFFKKEKSFTVPLSFSFFLVVKKK